MTSRQSIEKKIQNEIQNILDENTFFKNVDIVKEKDEILNTKSDNGF